MFRMCEHLPLRSGVLLLAIVVALCLGGGSAGEEHYRCFHDNNKKSVYAERTPDVSQDMCGKVDENKRFDCFPQGDISEQACEQRGCCWKEASSPGAPYCFYPSQYDSFRFLNMTEDKHAMTVYYEKARPSGYPDDFEVARMDFKYLSDDVLQIKIYDANNKRFEPPYPEITMAKPLSKMKYRVQVDAAMIGFKVIRNADNVTIIDTQDVGGLILSDKFLQMSAILSTDHVFGLGEKRGRFMNNMNWQTMAIFNRDRIPDEDLSLYGAHPFYMAVEQNGNTHGMLLLNSNAMDVVLQPTPGITYRTIGGILNLFVFMGTSPNDVVSQYTELVGRPFMPPYWSLGFHLCKYGYGSLNVTEQVWQSNRDAGIPFDTQWNDIDYMRDQNDFTYDTKKFAGLPEFVNKLHSEGMHYVMIIDPGIGASEKAGTYPPFDRGLEMDIFVKNSTNQPFVGKVWNSGSTVFPDFTHPNSTAYWVEMLKDYHKLVPYDGVWIEMESDEATFIGDSMRKRTRAWSPSQSAGRRPRKIRKRTAISAWVVEEVLPTLPNPSPTSVGAPSDASTLTSEEAMSGPAPVVTSVQSSELPTVAGFTADDVLKLLSTLRSDDKGKLSRLNNNHLHNVIPTFDPSSRAQNIETWLKKVNECASIYEWDQRQTIHFALQKVDGLAKKWYEALPSVNYSWDEWQAKLMRAFPNEQNYGRLLEEMLARTTRSNETLREYFYDKLTLINRCDITGKKAVDCIVHGIYDKSIRNGAQALNCGQPEDLLNFLNSQRPVDPNNIRKRIDNSQINRPLAASSSNQSESSVTCFNCRSKGHTFHKCPHPIIKCQKCYRVGHDSTACKLSPITPRQTYDSKTATQERKTLSISTVNNTNDKFFKKCTVNGKDFVSYIDFGSECTLMRDSDAQTLNLTKKTNELPVIKGFGNSSVVPIYRSFMTLRLDDVEACTEVLVVDDEFLRTSLLIGQDFTEQPAVTVLKDADKLIFYKSPVSNNVDQSERLKLLTIGSTNLKRIGLVEIRTEDSTFSGDIYVDGHSCADPGREYHLHQGAYHIDQGKGHLVVTNLGSDELVLTLNMLLARAIPFVEKEFYQVNRIVTDVSLFEPMKRADIKVGADVSNEVLDRLHHLLQSYRDCFAVNLSELGYAKGVEMNIELTDNKPVVYRPYRLSYSEREQVRGIIAELLQHDIIQESSSDYASPILMVRKKTGEQRLCVDFRALNNKTQKDCFPLPLIDDQLISLSGNRFFTSLDLASGYYQIPMAESSRRLTGFVTPDGHYEFKRMPFGLANAPAVFQRFINRMLGSKRFESALAYLDDILIPSQDLDQGFYRLEDVLKLLRENGLTLKLSKCRFFDSSINYLGYDISVQGIRPNELKILAVKEFPVPRSVHEVRQFLGLAGYFRKFIRNFGEIARPLTNLLKKDTPFQWSEKEFLSFSSLKEKLIERPILSLYDPKLETELHTDASALGVGGILLQWQENPRILKPVAYFSRQTTPEERHLHSYELETLAIVCSLKKFRVYLLGLNFKVVTDCHALRTTLTKRDLVPRIARWWLLISEFTFEIEYRPGTQMAHVDALSRNTKLNDLTDDLTATVYNIDTENWLLTLQMTDPDVSRIVKVLKPENDEESKDIKKNYVIQNNKVYRKVDSGIRMVVPRSARFQICRANHDDVGHFGMSKTLERVQNYFWFPKMRKFIKKYVESCIQCAYNKDSSAKQKTGHLHPIQKIDIPFHTIHIDHLGPFVRSKRGNAHILTVVDGFTKYVFVKPVKDTKTKSTVKVLENIFYDFGLPSRIISDRGTSFTSGAFRIFCEFHAIKHVLNAVACPRANGQAERFNQTILSALMKHNSGKNENGWDTCLGQIQWGINNSINSTTKKTASEALFGSRLRDSLANKLDVDVNALPSSIQTIREEVSANIKNSQEKQKRDHDAGRAPAAVYREGDLIKVARSNFYNKGNSTKLMSKFTGPYKIEKFLGNDRYVIKNIPGYNKKNRLFETVVAADRIRPWININKVNSNSKKNCNSSEEFSSSESDDNTPLSALQQPVTKN